MNKIAITLVIGFVGVQFSFSSNLRHFEWHERDEHELDESFDNWRPHCFARIFC